MKEDDLVQLLSVEYNITVMWLGMQVDGKLQDLNALQYWSDGRPAFYTAWHPLSVTGAEANGQALCMRFVAEHRDRWYLGKCERHLPFICKYDDYRPNERIEATNNTFCPRDWTHIGQHCYWIKPEMQTTWKEAIEMCLNRDSSSMLAIVDGDTENDVLAYYLKVKSFKSRDLRVWLG